MTISGHSTIGGVEVPGRAGTLRAVDARTGASLEPAFTLVGPAEVERATRLAEEAFDAYRATSPERRAASSSPSPGTSRRMANASSGGPPPRAACP